MSTPYAAQALMVALPDASGVLAAAPVLRAGVTWFMLAGGVAMILVLFMVVRILRLMRTGSAHNHDHAHEAPPPPPKIAPSEFGPGTHLRSLRLTMSAAAFLVPMAIAVVITGIAGATASNNQLLSENPFGVHVVTQTYPGNGHWMRWMGDGDPGVWILLAVVSALIAGHVGLLRAAYAGRAATSGAFFQGIKDHTFTFFLGKLMLAASVAIISNIIGARVTWQAVLFVIPSLLLAPLIGTAALYPRQPVKAIKAALSHSTGDIHGTGRLVTIQVLLLLTAWMVFSAAHSGGSWQKIGAVLPLPLFANGVNTLSFNTFPMFQVFQGDPVQLAAMVFTVICSTVFLGCHFLRVMDSVAEREGSGQAVPAGQAA